jgi:site-specific recombinase XerD
MQIQHAIRLMREVCMLRHLSVNTEKTYTHWLGRYGSFLKEPKHEAPTPELKMQAFLTRLAITGVSASTQNQAFNALLFFYREVLKKELGPVDALRAKRPCAIRQCPTQDEVTKLLSAVSDIYGYRKGVAVFAVPKSGLLESITIGDQHFSYKPLNESPAQITRAQ